MPLAYSNPSNSDRTPLRRRANALALTLFVHLLLLLMLLKLAPDQWRRSEERPPITFQLLPDAPKATRQAPIVRKTRRADKAAPKAEKKAPPLPAPPTPLLVPGLEHFDLRQVHSSAAEAQADTGQAAAGHGQDSASLYGPGEGPGGARLYNAEWYREPTNAELSYYLPPGQHLGWGMIACRTVERFHVDDCRTLGDSPPGSGLARAIREAAWQFLVRPPRIDGKPLIGAWVRIRIEFTEGGASARSSGQ